MSCWEPWYYGNEPKAGECPECGGDVDEDGDATNGCGYSPVICSTCGAAPCDESC